MTYLEYKGYLGTIEPELEDNTLFGKLAFIRDLVTYEANDLAGLRQEFEQSVEAYLESCRELGRAPDTPFKGTFNVRVSPEIHRQAAMLAGGRSLNAFVAEALAEKISRAL
jgi:predicted HicB family RNase H-like nuclease